MRRIVLITTIIILLLLSEAVTFLATRAATAPGAVQVDSLDFYYKLDQKVRFLDLKTRWQSEHRGELPLDKARELAGEAYAIAGTESPLEVWRYQGGPSPFIFNSKIHMHNQGRKALLSMPVSVSVRAKVGALRVNPAIQMTDFEFLEESAHWETVSTETLTVPAMAPGEDMSLQVMQFRLLDFLAKHPNSWPTQVEVRVSSPGMKTTYKTLALVPDHFVVPVLY